MYLFYDTETTGKAKNFKEPAGIGDNWPNIVQLGYAIYNREGQEILAANSIIKPNGWTITAEAQEIHGISLEQATAEGIPILDALKPFLTLHSKAQLRTCHNLGFDDPVVQSECLRVKIPYRLNERKQFCTMKSSTPILKLKGKFPGTYKWPTLIELHTHLFKEGFDGAHDALGDVRATARCFFELWNRNLIKP